jgi:hypothetical protein
MPKQRLPKHILRLFPNLNALNHHVTSPADARYNCAAWAAGDTTKWWDRFQYWPKATARTDAREAAEAAFASIGFVRCEDGRLEDRFEKIAIYERSGRWTHVARQLPDGHWTSKLGQAQDICHKTVSALFSDTYGRSVAFMQRSNDRH